ncbi:hypothetical protein AnigIFM60653_002800 [Aspergillus niger]|nr:hypothetical protein AnigIFM50267_000476 [Aspergillus niger]GLA03200.1 hypothetical protein AnigIFM60653_002800 [Aspergillus niger]
METNSGLKTPFAKLDLRDRKPVSPFGKLPLEIVYQICKFLPSDSLKALAEASLYIHLVTQDNLFWKQFMQRNMPWFWELQAAKNQKIPADLNYKRMYMWLDKMTAPRYGMDDVKLIGVANRRRIWGVCEDLADRYSKSLNQPTACEMPDRRLPTTRFNLSVRHVVADSTIYGDLVTRVTWRYGINHK